MIRTAGIVLAGGRSSRMGTAKASLDWRGAPLLEQVTGAVAAAVGRVVVVSSPGQSLPALPASVGLVADARPGRGPLEGMLAGLRALEGSGVDVVFVAAVDLPALRPSLVARIVAAIGVDDDAAVPVISGRAQPLAAAYRRARVLPVVEELAGGHSRRMSDLLERLRVVPLDEAALLADPAVAAADPRLLGLRDLDTPADYAAARGQARREKATVVPATTRSASSGTQASAVAPASEVTAWEV